MGKPLDPTRNHRIDLTEAAEQTRAHRQGGSFRTGDGGAFNAKPIQELLAQKGCVGLRYYKGRDKEGGDTMILVGVDEGGNDMVGGVLLEYNFPCPPFCTDENALTG